MAARPPTVYAGHARFEVLTPALIRLEYSQDGHFQNAPTMTATRATLAATPFEDRLRHGVLTLRTAKITLRYTLAGGPFSASDLTLAMRVSGRRVTVHPSAGTRAGKPRRLDARAR